MDWNTSATRIVVMLVAVCVISQLAWSQQSSYLLPEEYLWDTEGGDPADDWAYATYASLVSYRLMRGWDIPEFSVDDLAHNHGFATDIGQWYMSIPYFARGSGPEELFLTAAREIKGTDRMKQYLQSNGALFTHAGWPAVTIIGYDDSHNNGSWKVRPFDGGSDFWVDYDDCQFGVTYETDKTNNVVGRFQHDYYGATKSPLTIGEPHESMCIATRHIGGGEIGSVGFYTYESSRVQNEDVDFEIRIHNVGFAGYISDDNLVYTQTGTVTNGGWHVIELDEVVNLPSGSQWALWLELSNFTYAFESDEEGYIETDTYRYPHSSYSIDGGIWHTLPDEFAEYCVNGADWAMKAYRVPEPGSVMLVALGSLAVLLRRRRRAI